VPNPNDLNLAEWQAVAKLTRTSLANSKFPLFDDSRTLRSALQKLDPTAAPKPHRPLPPLPTGPMVGSRRKARR
jgi:hypothetical protein